MELIKCGKKGQVTIPKDMMDKPDLTGHSPMLVELTDDGAIVLRRAAVVPLETCTDERIAEFEREGRRCRGIVTAQSRIFANSASLL
jgi:AbrB family looped-hinge helix DNA binding protein